MSSGGIFKIISNIGKIDEVLMASTMLKARINDIIEARTEAGMENTMPTLKDLQKSHITHFQSNFKPFAAIGYEYQLVTPQSGDTSFGGTVTFSIPQFGDFLSDAVLHIVASDTSYTGAATPALPVLQSPGTTDDESVKTIATMNGTINTIENISTGGVIRRSIVVRYVNSDGEVVAPGQVVADNIRYCDFPGERIIKAARFEIHGNPIDDYNTMSYVFYRNFHLTEDKKIGYYRSMGQELPVPAISDVLDTKASIGGPTRKMGYILNGLQTPKKKQERLDVWPKLLFWFNLRPGEAIPSAAIPYGQRFINLDIATLDQMLFRAPAVWLETIVDTEFYSASFPAGTTDGNFDLSAIGTPSNISRSVVRTAILTNGGIIDPIIEKVEMYMNNIFTIPEVHDIYIERVGFSLIRVHRSQSVQVTVGAAEILASQFKYPIETIYFGIRPTINVTGPDAATDWHKLTKVTHRWTEHSSIRAAESTGAYIHTTENLQWEENQRTIDDVSVRVHGVVLYRSIKSPFYNQYIPEAFGPYITTPNDTGAMMLNFCLHPGIYQPSGHINVSMTREFYIKYTSSVIAPAFTGSLVLEAKALNFLLISDGNALLRYST